MSFIVFLLVTISMATSYVGNGFDITSKKYMSMPIIADSNQISVYPLDKSFRPIMETCEESSEIFTSKVTFNSDFIFDKESCFADDTNSHSVCVIAHGTYYWSYNIASLGPIKSLILSPMFELATKNFPETIETDNDMSYAIEYVNTYGQYLIYKSIFGARLDFRVTTSETLVKEYTGDWINTLGGFSLLYYLHGTSVDEYENTTGIRVDDEFLAQTKFDATFYGGDPNLANVNKLEQWFMSKNQNLYPLIPTYVPIWELIEDPIKKFTMKKFMRGWIRDQSL
jgi:hypothetical protein